ncbi:MAG: hypothetical protein M3361_13205, partial [Candidatus Tectomicrobia bacterium]|nr:hypothetical protein [Candidatus Tectomicrobia bacterium]
DNSGLRQQARTMFLTCLPRCVSASLRGLRPCVRHRHHVVCSGLWVLPLVYGARAHLTALARHGPRPLASQHYRRRLGAASWCTQTWLWGVADQALPALPPPEHGRLSLGADSTLTGQRGATHPVAPTTRLSPPHPSVCGCRSVVLMGPGDVDRLPVDVARLRRPGAAGDQSDNALFRPLLQAFPRPAWCQEVIVVAAAADAARAHLAALQALGSWSVMALPRTRQVANGKARKDRVTPLPRWGDRQSRMPSGNGQRRRPCWGYAKRPRWRQLGAVTVVLSPCRRNEGPKPPKILVPHRPQTGPARQRVALSLRRWWGALLVQALKGVVGVGQPQGTNQVERVARSGAVAVMAYLFLRRLQAQHLPADRPWRAVQRQRRFAWEVLQEPCERSARQRAWKWLQRGKAA